MQLYLSSNSLYTPTAVLLTFSMICRFLFRSREVFPRVLESRIWRAPCYTRMYGVLGQIVSGHLGVYAFQLAKDIVWQAALWRFQRPHFYPVSVQITNFRTTLIILEIFQVPDSDPKRLLSDAESISNTFRHLITGITLASVHMCPSTSLRARISAASPWSLCGGFWLRPEVYDALKHVGGG